MTLILGRFQQVAFGTDEAFQRHDDLFPRRIDRRVGHLGKQLFEVVVGHARLIAEHGKRRIVTHRTERVFFRANHWHQHELQRLDRIAERLHAVEQFFRVVFRSGSLLGKFVEGDTLVFQPFAIRTFRRVIVLQLIV